MVDGVVPRVRDRGRCGPLPSHLERVRGPEGSGRWTGLSRRRLTSTPIPVWTKCDGPKFKWKWLVIHTAKRSLGVDVSPSPYLSGTKHSDDPTMHTDVYLPTFGTDRTSSTTHVG